MRRLPIVSFSLATMLTLATTEAAAASYWSWGISASADAFETSMENPADGILFDNWPIDHWTVHIDDTQTFQELVVNHDRLRNVVANRVRDICQSQGNNEHLCLSARNYLRSACVQEDDSAYMAAYRFALTFHELSQDNWFSFDMVLAKMQDYLTGNMSLRLYMGFDTNNVISIGGISLPDLPVVINHDEQTLTIFSAILID